MMEQELRLGQSVSWTELYAKFRDQFAKAIDTRFYTLEYLDWMLMSGRAAIWFSDNASIVCEIKSFPTGARAIAGVIAAGDAGEIVEALIPQAEEWGKANGCKFAMIESRAAWQKKMKPHGYEPFQLALVKEL